MHMHDNNIIILLLKTTITHACDLYTSFDETCRVMLGGGRGGVGQRMVWSRVVYISEVAEEIWRRAV